VIWNDFLFLPPLGTYLLDDVSKNIKKIRLSSIYSGILWVWIRRDRKSKIHELKTGQNEASLIHSNLGNFPNRKMHNPTHVQFVSHINRMSISCLSQVIKSFLRPKTEICWIGSVLTEAKPIVIKGKDREALDLASHVFDLEYWLVVIMVWWRCMVDLQLVVLGKLIALFLNPCKLTLK